MEGNREHQGITISRRKLLKMIGLGSAGIYLTACSGGATPAPTAGTAANGAGTAPASTAPAGAAAAAATTAPTVVSKKPVELRYYDYKLSDQGRPEVLKKITDEFTKKYNWITVKFEEVAYADYLKKLVIQAQGGTPPDVARIDDSAILPLVDIGALAPLTDWAQTNKLDDFLTDMPQALRKAYQVKGVDFMAFSNSSMDVLTLNKDLLKAAGLDPEKPPKSWDELVEFAKKLTVPSKDQYGWGIISERSSSSSRRVLAWMVSSGGELFNADKTELIINSDAGLKGFQFWVDLANKHNVAPPGSVNMKFKDVMTGFGQGKIAMFDGGPNNPKIAEVDYPGIVDRTNMAAMPDPWRVPLRLGGYATMAGSKNKEEAMLLTSWMASTFGQVEWALGEYTVPIRASAANDPKIKAERLIAQTAALVTKGIANPAIHPKWAELEQKLLDSMQAALSGGRTPKEALDDFVSEGNKILKRA